MIDAEDLATGNYEDDQTILQMISNKMKQSKDKMTEIDIAFNKLGVARTHDGRIPKRDIKRIERRVEEIEMAQKRYLLREKNAENSYINFMLFIIFFPQLIAGPIMRANQLLPQLYNRPKVTQNDIRIGANYFINGLFLKVVLADNISPLVDAAFEVNPSLLGFLDISTMAFLFLTCT